MLHHCRQNFAIDVKAVSISLMVTHPQVPALAEIQRSQRGHAGPGDVLMHLQVARARNVQAPQLAEHADLRSQVPQAARAHRQQPQLRQLEQSLRTMGNSGWCEVHKPGNAHCHEKF